MVSTSIALDGEKEFKRQLGDVNSNLRTLKSELQLTTEEFKGQANSVDALEAKGRILSGQYEQQEEKVKALERALRDVGEVYADQPRKIDEYQQSLNRARTDLAKLGRELQDNERYLKEARASTDKTTKSLDEFGREAKDADDGLDRFNVGLDNLKGLLVGGALGIGVKSIAESLIAVVDATEEYRRVTGLLEVSSQAAGYSAEQTSEAYTRLYGVLADPQATATTIANLQAIGLEQDQLMVLIDQVTGAWAKYGDSIPIDGLAEAINETIQAGQVTGVFADVLNWAGVNEDEFNEKLAAASTTAERQNIVLQELSRQGLAEMTQSYREANAATIEANEAQAAYEAKQAEFAEKVLPFKTMLVELATGGWDVLTNSIQTAIDLWNEAQALFSTESALRQDGLIVSQEDRMAAYGYEKYYNEEGLLRYRQVESDLAGANTTSKPAATAEDVAAAAASSWAYSQQANARKSEYIGTTTIVIDGREVAKATQPYLRDEDLSNPEVVSDTL